MAQYLFYENLVPLNRERHKNLRLQPGKAGFGHVKHMNSIPIAAVEFAEVAHDYAIGFTGASKDAVAPAAILGLSENTNYYVDDDGNWAEGYRPAFVRMYPFMLANRGQDGFAVCIDESHKGLNEEEGERLFEEDGTESARMKQAMEFLTRFQGEMRRTGELISILQEHDLLIEQGVQVKRADGQMVNLKGIFVIDETKVRNLPDDVILKMHKNGMMACVYAHLMSLRNLARLTNHASSPIKVAK